jgi:DNA-binding NarL/FixJ family response regulator
MLTVLIADDHALIRSGFRMILEAEPDIEVVGEAADGGEAVRLVRELEPDVVLMDVRMPEVDGLEATRLLAGSGARTRILMLTTFDLDRYVHDALLAGAAGFLLKDSSPERLVAGVRAVARGEPCLAPGVMDRIVVELLRRPSTSAARPARLSDLTAREAEVLLLIARGLTNAEIAARLVVSEATVKTHVAHILRKLELRDRVQVVVLAYESGIATREAG